MALVSNAPMLLVVNPNLPARGLREFLALDRSRPGALNCATPGTGTLPHPVYEMVKAETCLAAQLVIWAAERRRRSRRPHRRQTRMSREPAGMIRGRIQARTLSNPIPRRHP